MTLFFRLIDEENKADSLALMVRQRGSENEFEVDPNFLRELPGSPFSYWVSNRVRGAFKHFSKFNANGRAIKQGLATADDFRFVRSWWEVAELDIYHKWFCFAKGGQYSQFYSDVHLLVNWRNEGLEICNFTDINSGRTYSRPQNTNFYFRPGLTWSDRTTKRFSARIWPAGGVFSVKGSAGFFPEEEFFALALMNSTPFNGLISLLVGAGDAAARSYQVGVIGEVPYAPFSAEAAELARCGWLLKRRIDTVNETSHAFILPKVLLKRASEFDQVEIERELNAITEKIDDIVFNLYELDSDDRLSIERWLGKKESTLLEEQDDDPVDETEDNNLNDLEGLLSWCVGVIFGRFDLRIATGERAYSVESKPFEPLPTRSPGMLPDGDVPINTFFDILVDDPGHNYDISNLIQEILDQVNAPEELSIEYCRNWIAKEFFSFHIKMYSKSRRKSPIYWQLSTVTANYSVWLYIHAFSKDTLFRVQNEFVAPKLLLEERTLESMRQQFGSSPNVNERKQLAMQESFVEELSIFLAEVKRVAPLWNPDLDDGVVINFAPLWRLVPQHKTWQKELKATWDALCRGEYDWAQWAMHLWPERVIPRCAYDRSLAIAHGLEDVFWVVGTDGKWNPRKKLIQSVNDLIRTRTSPAVKEALKNILEAPAKSENRTRRTPGRGGRE